MGGSTLYPYVRHFQFQFSPRHQGVESIHVKNTMTMRDEVMLNMIFSDLSSLKE